jgi:hypothetical protein
MLFSLETAFRCFFSLCFLVAFSFFRLSSLFVAVLLFQSLIVEDAKFSHILRILNTNVDGRQRVSSFFLLFIRISIPPDPYPLAPSPIIFSSLRQTYFSIAFLFHLCSVIFFAFLRFFFLSLSPSVPLNSRSFASLTFPSFLLTFFSLFSCQSHIEFCALFSLRFCFCFPSHTGRLRPHQDQGYRPSFRHHHRQEGLHLLEQARWCVALLFFELSVCPSDSFLGLRFFFLSR